MVRNKAGDKEASRDEIVRKAAARFRKEGLSAVGVRPIMADAGLTHGAFYAYFPSRSDLVCAAIDFGLDGTLVQLEAAVERAGAERGLEMIVNGYLRREHRDHPELGCAAAALAPEMARENEEVRAHMISGVDRIAAFIARCLPPGGTAGARKARAHAIFALMFGSLQMMRIAIRDEDVDMHMNAGREAAMALARRPWD